MTHTVSLEQIISEADWILERAWIHNSYLQGLSWTDVAKQSVEDTKIAFAHGQAVACSVGAMEIARIWAGGLDFKEAGKGFGDWAPFRVVLGPVRADKSLEAALTLLCYAIKRVDPRFLTSKKYFPNWASVDWKPTRKTPFADVADMDGFISKWNDEKLPTLKEDKRVELRRRVFREAQMLARATDLILSAQESQKQKETNSA